MADKQQVMERGHGHDVHVSGKTTVVASAAGLMIGGVDGNELHGCDQSFPHKLATPHNIQPPTRLFGAACVFGLALTGFTVVGAMAVAGLWLVSWVLQSGRLVVYGGGVDKEKEQRQDQIQYYNYHVPYQTN